MLSATTAAQASSGAFVAREVIGTVAFALSGVMAAARAGMDWLGAAVLALVVAIGGGTIRDVLLGQLPVSWLDRYWPVLVALGTAAGMLLVLRLRPGQRAVQVCCPHPNGCRLDLRQGARDVACLP